ncbi:hypothetical protein SAY86_020567 [Trapa natans]|uniref:Uncharacterized protein n=1 Tax=Trapa natans TaxID=22666 RepID=A0AAN7LZS2_TRANT|nr:hypothetical protein SAY86_020567 [Trapa natans]
MLKRTASRNQRSRGVKMRHVLQILVLLGICFWLIYQVKYSHDKRKELSGNDVKPSNTEHVSTDLLKLGRKDLKPIMEDIGGKNGKDIGEDEEEEDKRDERETELEEESEGEMGKSEVEETKELEGEEKEQEVEEEEEDEEEKEHHLEEGDSKGDEIEDQDKLRDDIDREEDFIDKEKEREEDSSLDKESAEDSEEVEEEEKQSQVEDEHQNLNEDGTNDEVDMTTHEAREENYKGDDASSAVTHHHDELISSEVVNMNLEFANESDIVNSMSNQFSGEEKNRSEAENGKILEMADKVLDLRDTVAEKKDNANGTGAAIALEDSPPQNLTVSSENNDVKIAVTKMNAGDLSMAPPNGTETAFHSPEAQNSTTDGVNSSNLTSRGDETRVLPTPNAGSMEFSNSTGTDLDSVVLSSQRNSSDEKGDVEGNIRLPSTLKEENMQSQDSTERQNEPDEIKTG